jgi:hypothetical protein
MEALKPGDSVKVPNVLPFKIEDLKEGFIPANPLLPTARSTLIRRNVSF